jgi:hypothetical protein
LEVENVSARLVLSDQADAHELKKACLNFMKGSAAEVMKTSGWASVQSHQAGALAIEVLQAVVGEPQSQNKRPAAEEETDKEAELAQVDWMTTAALRSALTGRSLIASGRKGELARRLKEAIRADGY